MTLSPSTTGRQSWFPLEERPACCAPQPLIEVQQLSVHYGQKPAFRDVTVAINQGCITALIGPSGCGKTSFLSSLNRLTDLIPGCRVSGRICLDGLDVLPPDTDVIRLRRRIGMIFQKPNPFPLSIRKNLEFPLREHGFRDREQLARTIETGLRDVGLWDEVKDRLDSPALALSGGQQQRLCMARALVLSPDVLLIEDEKLIRRFLRSTLEEEGCRVFEAETLACGIEQAGDRRPALVVLDLGLPDGNGIDFIQRFRNWSDAPILVLSARSNEKDKIQALDTGADDYLTKPFGVGELRARARALLRRQSRSGEAATPIIEFGNVRVDLSRRLVTRNGAPIRLTPIEYRLLSVLLANAGKVMTQRHLLREVWGPSHVESSHYLRIYVGHLRQKLEDDPTQPAYLITETGVGYRFQL